MEKIYNDKELQNWFLNFCKDNQGCYIMTEDEKYEQDQRIAELEEQLKNAIILPIPLGEKCWSINSWVNRDMKREYSLHENTVSAYEVYKMMINNEPTLQVVPRCSTNYLGVMPYVFATKDEALAKLEELKGEM